MANKWNKDRKEIALRNTSRTLGVFFRENPTPENHKKWQDKMHEWLKYISDRDEKNKNTP